MGTVRVSWFVVPAALAVACSSGSGSAPVDAGTDGSSTGGGGSGNAAGVGGATGGSGGATGGSGGISGAAGSALGGAAGISGGGGSAGSGGSGVDAGGDACAAACSGPTACGSTNCTCAGAAQGVVGVPCISGCCASQSVTCVEACTMLNCGPGPGSGTGATPVTLAMVSGGSMLALRVDGGFVYYADIGNKTVGRVPLSGGTAQVLSAANAPMGLAIDATHVYWVTQAGDVQRVVKGGGSAETLASALGNTNGGIGIDASDVYVFAGGSKATLYRIAKSGGSPVTLVSTSYYAGHLLIDAGAVYVSTNSSNKVLRWTSPATSFTEVGTTAPLVASWLAIGAGQIYVTSDNALGAVHGGPLPGGPIKPMAGLQESPSRVAADASAVYFAHRVCNKVLRMPHGGGALTLLGTLPVSVVGLDIDATSVYAGTASGQIAKLPK